MRVLKSVCSDSLQPYLRVPGQRNKFEGGEFTVLYACYVLRMWEEYHEAIGIFDLGIFNRHVALFPYGDS